MADTEVYGVRDRCGVHESRLTSMSMAELAFILVKSSPSSNGHSSVWGLAALAIIPIALYLRVRQGRQSPRDRYTPPPADIGAGQDPMTSGFTDPSSADTYNPTFQPAPAPPPFTYGQGTPANGVADFYAPPPPAFVPGLPQFNAPPPPMSVPHAVPTNLPGALPANLAGTVPAAQPGAVPNAMPGPSVPAPSGLTAAGTFTSQSLRIGYGISLFMTALVIGMLSGGPVLLFHSIADRKLVPQSLVLNLAVVAALVLFVRALRVGISYDADGVVARSIFQSHRWAWPQLQEIQIENALVNSQSRTGQNRMRKMMRIIETDGKFTVTRALTAPAGGPNDRSWLDDAASALNAQIQLRRPDSGVGPGGLPYPVSWSTN
jgi:hypothetical protein